MLADAIDQPVEVALPHGRGRHFRAEGRGTLLEETGYPF
jgi:hypothetical protein